LSDKPAPMRRLAANYVFPVIGPPIRNGILEMHDSGEIIRVISPGQDFRETRKLEFYNGILVPGFINAHCHLEWACLKGRLSRGLGLHGFLRQAMRLRDSCAPQAHIQAMKEADRQMKSNGIVAAGDVSHTGMSFQVKQESALSYHTCIGLCGVTSRQVEWQAEWAKKLLHSLWHDHGLRGNLTAHALYSSDRRVLRHIVRENRQADNPVVSIHHREYGLSAQMMMRILHKLRTHQQEKSLEFSHWMPLSLKGLVCELEPALDKTSLLLVHNLHIPQHVIRYAARHIPRLTWVVSPRSGMFIHGRLPGLMPFIGQGQSVALGTDALASNEELSILEEMKHLSHQHPEVPFATLLQWATINGARAVFPDTGLGCFKPGKAPGVNLIRPFDFTRMRLTADSRVFPLA